MILMVGVTQPMCHCLLASSGDPCRLFAGLHCFSEDSEAVARKQGQPAPETQNPDDFADGIKYVTEAHQQVAQAYLDDGPVEQACPPQRALIHIMAKGEFEGMTVADARLRHMFTRDYLLSSDWYRERLVTKQQLEIALWQRHLAYLEAYKSGSNRADVANRLGLEQRQSIAKAQLLAAQSEQYLASLVGTLGADPLGHVTR